MTPVGPERLSDHVSLGVLTRVFPPDVVDAVIERTGAAVLGVDFESLAGGLEGITQGVADGAGEYATGLGEQVKDLGSNFEIPGLSALGNLFGRD